MQHEMVQHLPIEEIPSPDLNTQIFDFCESELFTETLQNSEVASNSNGCYEEQSSYSTNLSLTPDMNKYTNNNNNNNSVNDELPETLANTQTNMALNNNINPTNTLIPPNNNNLSVIFDSTDNIDNDISVSIDFNIPQYIPNQQNQFNYSSLNSSNSDCAVAQYNSEPSGVPFMGHPMPPVYEDECLSSVPPPYIRLNTSSPSCAMLDPVPIGPYMPGNLSAALAAGTDNTGLFGGECLFLGNELQPQELDYQAENGAIFCTDAIPRNYNCNADLQAISNESQHFVNGTASSNPLASEIASLDDPTFKVGKLTPEERREKIHRYLKKRNERNFSKKIKYACRKTLADSRPRVRGRFAKNDELEMMNRAACYISHHEEDTDEDVVVKDDDDIDSSDIMAHLHEWIPA